MKKIILIIILLILLGLLMYSFCVMAGQTDDAAEKSWENFSKKENK